MPPNPPSNSRLPRLAVWSGYGTARPPDPEFEVLTTLPHSLHLTSITRQGF